MSTASRVEELLLRWKEQSEGGQALSIEDLCRTCPELVGEVASRLTATQNAPVSHAPPDGTAPGWPKVPGYEMMGELGRGGMGAVHKGRDQEMGREVAVKVLLEAHQGNAELVQRFVEEARIAGQLQHPGVTPVYELGRFGAQ